MKIEIKKISATEIMPFFKSLNEKEIIDEALLTEFILKQIGVRFRPEDFAIAEGEYLPRNNSYRIKMWADELARFLIFLHQHKERINSYLEFGTYTGGTFMVIDSYLRAVNPNMGKSVTIDKWQGHKELLDSYKAKYPQMEWVQINSIDYQVTQHYDMCLIDADHSYSSVKRDYEKVKEHCSYIAFHDIVLVSHRKPNQLSARHLWAELNGKKTEIITKDPRISFMSGIGILDQT